MLFYLALVFSSYSKCRTEDIDPTRTRTNAKRPMIGRRNTTSSPNTQIVSTHRSILIRGLKIGLPRATKLWEALVYMSVGGNGRRSNMSTSSFCLSVLARCNRAVLRSAICVHISTQLQPMSC